MSQPVRDPLIDAIRLLADNEILTPEDTSRCVLRWFDLERVRQAKAEREAAELAQQPIHAWRYENRDGPYVCGQPMVRGKTRGTIISGASVSCPQCLEIQQAEKGP